MLKKSLLIFFLLSCFFFALNTRAEIQSEGIVLHLNPEYPKARESVVASLSTYNIDLNNARISWTINGTTTLEGVGKKTFSFTVGDSGFQTNLNVKIETIDGSVINKEITISPSSVDLLWQSYDTYTPPFYKGKTLAPVEGSVKVVAIPEIQNLAGLNYKWKEDNKNKPSSSGYEKDYFLYKNSYLEDNNTVEVAVSDLFRNNIGYNKILVNPVSPKIIFYKKDPNLGTKWENSISNGFTINKDGETIVAEPYFFSNRDLESTNYDFKWFLNGEETAISNRKNILAIRPEEGKSGNTVIKVIINNTKTLFQSVEKQINVSF